uniref:Uncharacterized protein n=1 Tax=Ixodes ricinus TaxID=34613 RepID=A0A6B0UW64_IXORI
MFGPLAVALRMMLFLRKVWKEKPRLSQRGTLVNLSARVGPARCVSSLACGRRFAVFGTFLGTSCLLLFFFFSCDLVRAQFFRFKMACFFPSPLPSRPVHLPSSWTEAIQTPCLEGRRCGRAFHGSTISVWTLLWQQRKVPMAWCVS